MKRVARIALGLWLVLFGQLPQVLAQLPEDQLLPAEKAFGAKARTLDGKTIEVRFAVAPDHYLYRQRFKVEVAGKVIPASRIVLPSGKVKRDPTFGRVETYEGALTLKIRDAGGQGKGPVMLKVISQGCAEKAGVCYPPFAQSFELSGNSSNWYSPKSGSEGSFAVTPSLNRWVQAP